MNFTPWSKIEYWNQYNLLYYINIKMTLGHFISLKPVIWVWRFFAVSCPEFSYTIIVELGNIMCYILSLLKEDCKKNNLPYWIKKSRQPILSHEGLMLCIGFCLGGLPRSRPAKFQNGQKLKLGVGNPRIIN